MTIVPDKEAVSKAMMSTPPPITTSQLQMLRSLLAKKGWSEAYFAWKTNVALTELTTSQARDWITRRTKETKGQPRPMALLEPPGRRSLSSHGARPQRRHQWRRRPQRPAQRLQTWTLRPPPPP